MSWRLSETRWVWTTAVAAVVAASLAAAFLLLRNPAAGQDSCTFGAITSKRYGEIRAAADKLVTGDRRDWKRHFSERDLGATTALLQGQQSALFDGLTSVQERVAAMHALARAHGAIFTRVEPDTPDPWGASPDNAPAAVLYVYSLNANRIEGWRFLRRWVRIDATFAVRDIGPGFERARGIERDTLSMFVTGTGTTPQISTPRPSRFHDCPPVPTAIWQDEYLKPPPAPAEETGAPTAAGAADHLVTLATGLMARGRLRLALPHLEKALDLSEAANGPDHEETAEILDLLAGAYAEAGQPLKAAEFEGRALDARIRAAEKSGLQ